MNAELKEIRDAWDKEIGGRDENLTRQLADAYVDAHPDVFSGFLEGVSQENCVQMIDVFRANGNDDMVWTVQAWLFHRFEPQVIGGQVAVERIRIPEN